MSHTDFVDSHTLLLAKDDYIVRRLERELKGNFSPETKAKKKAQLETIVRRSVLAVQARLDSIPDDLVDKLNTDLPVTARADEIIHAIRSHQVIIVAGETGSGKTTQLPKLAMLAGRGITGQIGHTQPRRLAARSVAMRIAEELGESLGETVSFKVRFTEQGSRNSIIKLMTDGILLAELGSDKFLTRYDTIIIDEAHERSLNIDFILGYLKRLLPKRPDLKVIITSATLDTARFADYFKEAVNGDVPIINVEGRSYPVETRYRPLIDEIVKSYDDDAFDEVEDKLPRALTAAVAECFEDARQKGHPTQADILIFASTEAQIREIGEILTAHAPPHTQILPLFARQSFAEQQKIFHPTGGRRIIISTNVAETALTVPNIRYVIDLGFARISRYNYRSRIQRLPIEAISQAAANQRQGRCGRIGDGVCIRLYSKEDFDSRPEFTEPEILRTNLASVILQMAHLGLGDVAAFDFITPPDLRLINDGKKLLHELGALTEAPTKTALKKSLHGKGKAVTNVLTDIGKKMARMPIDPRLARMLIAGHEFACLDKMLIIVSALAVQDVRERPADKQTQADQKHALFRRDDSDFLFYIELFEVLFDTHQMHGEQKLTGNARKNFAKKHYLSFPRIKEWQKTHEQLKEMMRDLGYQIHDETKDDAKKINAINKKDGRIGLKGDKKAAAKNVSLTSLKDAKAKLDKNKAVYLGQDYASIHRALLTALLSFVAHKSDAAGEYLMTKNQKARIFPASTLHKKGVDWVVAFEVVETSNVYMRTLAKIDPEWILSAAKNLLKYHYFEPHWSKKVGRVQAYAQISLFGLIIIHKQLVNYEAIDLAASREIFIRDALVGDIQGMQNGSVDERYPKALPFLTHNRQKIKDVGDTEDKLRRRDLLVDEERLYEFYDEKIPLHIASAKSFEDWLSQMGHDDFLKFKDSDIINDMVSVGQEFPKFWQVGAVKFPLSYVFDPSSDDDGVSVKVRVGALSQLDSVDLLWGIAGWRYELVVELLKTLPKDIRRKIVPIPDTAHVLMNKLMQGNGVGLLDQLCHNLLRMGVKVETDDFNIHEIDKYLQPLICVLDDKGRVIEKGRDLEKLQAKYERHTQIQRVSEGMHDDFPEHFEFIKTRHHKGMTTQTFFALSPDENAKVSIAEFGELSGALKMHKKGVLSLIKHSLGAKQKQLTGQIDKAFKMAFAPLGDLEKLKTLLIDATLQATFDKYATTFDDATRQKAAGFVRDERTGNLLDKLPLTISEFEQTKEVLTKQFLAVGQEMLKVLKEIYTTWQSVRGQMLMLDREIFGESIDDIEDQLDDLVLSDFIYRVDFEVWQQYPRYLQALKIRLDRLPNNLDNDTDGVYLLDEHMERLANRLHDPKIAEYRWLVEEYRIQLFAQPMKTSVPVSAKRLEKVWASVNTR